jgi:hypothetical protein
VVQDVIQTICTAVKTTVQMSKAKAVTQMYQPTVILQELGSFSALNNLRTKDQLALICFPSKEHFSNYRLVSGAMAKSVARVTRTREHTNTSCKGTKIILNIILESS